MLESAFASNQREQAEENISFIKDGVQECYEDVRELLMNFRTKKSVIKIFLKRRIAAGAF